MEGGARHLDQVGIGERRYGLAYSSGTPLLDVTARPLSSATDDETQILSVPVQLRRSGREIRMLIDRPDPFAAAKPDARLIKLLVRARLFNAALVSSADISFAALAKREGVSPSYFTRDVSQRTPLWRKTDSNHRSPAIATMVFARTLRPDAFHERDQAPEERMMIPPSVPVG